jgi:hypothetical protein
MAGFVCIYYGNTGSSWLLEMLGSSPDVLVPGFEPLETWAWDVDHDTKLHWLETALTPPGARYGPEYEAWAEELRASPQVKGDLLKPSFTQVGFKMNDLAAFEPERVAEVLARTGAKAIFLTRANRIKHALSLYRYHEEDKSQFHGKDRYAPTTVRFPRFHYWVEESERLHDLAGHIRAVCIERIGEENVFDLGYREFVHEEGKRDVSARLTQFLGVTPGAGDGKYAKATPDDLRSAVTNYWALRLRYLPTRHRRHLRD